MSAVEPDVDSRVVPHPEGRAARAVVGIGFWVLLPILGLVYLAIGGDKISQHINNTPSGIRGTYTVTAHSCQEQLCMTGGTFVSDDYRVVATNLLGDYRWQVGQQHPAVYNANAADVIPLPAHWDASGTVIGMAAILVLLGIWGWCVRRAVRARR